MMVAVATVDGLRREWPAWTPWLAVVEATVEEIGHAAWDRLTPARPNAAGGPAPWLAGTRVQVDPDLVAGWVGRLFKAAATRGGPRMAEAAQASAFNLDSLAVFAASVAQDAERIDAMARNVGADCAALQALAALVPVPFLHACARRWGAAPAARWTHPYCPVCGAWGAFREDRGGEAGREERCARCGSAWAGRFLSCPYCDTSDHDALVSLLPGHAPSQGSIVACQRCRGYVKTFTTLQPCPGPDVMLKDLASVDLDVAAITHGYRRPSKPGYRPAVTVRGQDA